MVTQFHLSSARLAIQWLGSTTYKNDAN